MAFNGLHARMVPEVMRTLFLFFFASFSCRIAINLLIHESLGPQVRRAAGDPYADTVAH